jgi:predicted transglutaminase-like cysteine proteinase
MCLPCYGEVMSGLRVSIACLSVILGALALQAHADAVPRCTPMDLPIAWIDSPPTQYTAFCERQPDSCLLEGEAVLDWTPRLHALLTSVNAAVNADIELVADVDNLGVEESWDLPPDCRGDCEDFALEKRERLRSVGIPSASLTMAIAFHEVKFFPHAILLVETTTGTWVLDNLQDEVLCWDAPPYRYTRRERPDGQWSRFESR